jgi:glutamate/aspartate transport system substrate-binding protein
MLSLKRKFAALCFCAFAGLSTASADDLRPTLQKIKDAGAITIGYRDTAIPMSYVDAEQKPIGFSVDLCAVIAEKIKQALSLSDLRVNYQLVIPANRAALLQDGTIDIECGATPDTAELRQQVAFSVPIYTSELRWIAPRKLRVEIEGSRYGRWETRTPSSTNDLRNKAVALTQGSAATSLVLSISSDRSLGLSILQGKDNAESFKLVESGKASAFLADDVLLVGLKATAKNPDAYAFLDDSYPGAPYGLMLRKGDAQFKDLVDAALTEAMNSGEYGKIYSKWFESPIPPRNVNLAYPMPERLKQLLKQPGNQAAAIKQN